MLKINNYDNATKSLDKVIRSQLIDNNKKGLGYNVIPPPLTGLFVPPSIDLSHSGIEKFKEPEFVGYDVKVDKIVFENSFIETKKTSDAPIIKDQVSDCEEDEIVSKVVKSVNVQQKPKQANEPRNASQIPRYNRENKNEQNSKRLGVGFQFSKRACFVCRRKKETGERESKPVWNDAMRTNLQNFSNNRRNFSPKAVLTKSGKVPISTARQSSPRAAVPISTTKPVNTAAPKSLVNVAKYKTNVFQKRHSPTRRPVHQEIAHKNRNLKNKVNTVKTNSINTVKTKRVTSAVGKKWVNAVKPSTYWVWRPKIKGIDHVSKASGSYICKRFDYGDPQVALKDTIIFYSGCSRHMTGNKSFLTSYQEYDGGFVFAGSSKGGKISSKGTIRTGNLDFKDMYFVKELKFNLFSLSQMCDKKNSILFTETECLILSPDFKLPDENQVMLKIPKKDNMYSFDLKNIVPSKGLTCFIAKATNNESKLWHRRLGHINFKTLNKLVKGNLVRVEPKKVNQAFDDVSWVEAMQEELLQFKLLNVWTLVDLPKGKKAIGRNKKYHKGIVVRNKPECRQDHRQEGGHRLMMNTFLYGTIEEEVYVNQPPGFEDPEFPNKVYKVEKALYGLHQAPRAWYETLSTYLLENGFRRGTIDKTLFIKKIKNDILLVQVYVDDIIFGSTKKSLSTEFEKLMHKRFQMSSMGELTFFLGLQVEQRKDGIFLSQDKYVYDILKKFGFTTVKTASTPMETHKSLSSNAAEPDVDVHLYRSMIGTLMYLTSSRPDIMFAVCACSRFQVTPKVSHMHAVKRIFRYLKGKPTLGLWYPKDSPMDLIAYSDSDYAGASIDRKSTTGGCQFLGSRLVSWQCKKQTIMANSTTEAEYIAASHCCGQVLWLQNQLLDYGYNFMRTKIHIDNESTISVIKNPVSHSKTKHIEIRFHFIRDSYEKKLIEMVKIHTDNNVADLLTKAFDVTRFEFLIASIVDTSVPSVLVVNHTTNGHQFTMSNRHQELASPKQTTLGKDKSNPFMVGSLPKTIKQSNDPPFSRGYTLRSGKNSLELMELMAHYT
ncbi:putative ribonuclease H-like domain-containing protein [Tanacetum coccineum]